ncbi:hypothetical protein SLS60_005107 [Paraconiothyrium brasiliense]|uniref:Heterokaryon incompatibility domain-containing protein n=1 Tax=Paraconiothyrium brasiliense TaxID=300254 RepID=A0ABR3RGE5_9PLEO
MTSKKYEYEPLRSKEIRLLHLSKADNGEPTFRLYRETLDDNLKYEAISYTWGSSVRGNVIYHADTGQGAFVTANCERVLRSLLATGNNRIWIDGLCINQDDVTERSQQVRLMGRIFRNANRTIAYIGEHDEHSRAVIAWADSPTSHWSTILEDKVSFKDHLHALQLLSRPFFRRTWVIQEVLLSTNLAITIGLEELNFDMLSMWDFKIFSTQRSPAKGVLTLKTEFSRGDNMQSYKKWAQSIMHQPKRLPQMNRLWKTPASALNLITATNLLNPGYLFDLLCATAAYDCTDPRDKIFALVSLFERGLPEALQPNYSCSVEELYTNVSAFLLTYGVARVLSAATYDEKGGLPSWAVDWRCKLHEDAFDRSVGAFAASSSAGFDSFRETNIRVCDKRAIKVRGLRLTQVSTCPRDVGQAAVHKDLTDMRELDADELLRWDRALSGARPPDQYLQYGSADGTTALVPKETQRGDWICVLLGFTVPFVLRPCPADEWKLVGECYVQNYMKGEAVQSVEKHHVHDPELIDPLVDFVLI